VLLLLSTGPLLADHTEQPLPSPLTLGYALSLADRPHPDERLARARLSEARARLAEVEADDELRLDFTAALKAIDPSPLADDQSHNDSGAKLRLSKRLYDFGRTARAREAAESARLGQQWRLLELRQQRRLDIMARFFDVLLADLRYARDNEAMSIAFVRLDRGRNRNQLGQLSDIELLELESRYQQARSQRFASQNQQRISRSLLAISLNRPGDLPGELEPPVLAALPPLEDVQTLTRQVLQSNPGLRALRAEVEAARQRLRAAEAQGRPEIRGELEAAAQQRELAGRNPLSASLVFEMPLFTGSRVSAAKAVQRARLQAQRARLESLELELRQQVLEGQLELQRLDVRRQELAVTGDFRDLFLERSRSLYDLEVESDLGDAMLRIADLSLQQAETRFQRYLLHARLEALAGRLIGSEPAAREQYDEE